jgi:hypothetical protein
MRQSLGLGVSPSRRTYIPKADRATEALALAALEDKIVQTGTVAVLNWIYDEFLGFSYGFRQGGGAIVLLLRLNPSKDAYVNFTLGP